MAGYKHIYNFINNIDDSLMCAICHDIVKEAMQHDFCGKIYCKICIDQVKNKSCPNCRKENSVYFRDKLSDKIILDLPVRCTNTERGCTWQGTVETLDNHMDTCEFTLIYCPNKCDQYDADPSVQRKDLEKHLSLDCINRTYRCEHCGIEDIYRHIINYHDKHCDKRIIQCPNSNCMHEFEQADKSKHMKTCEYTEVQCKYEELGCTVKKMRRDIAQHEEDDNIIHLTAASDTVDSLKEKVATLKDQLASFEELKVQVLKPDEPFLFILDNYNNHKMNKGSIVTEPFYTSPRGYKASITIHLKTDHLSVYLNILKGLYDDTLDWPFKELIKVELLNQVNDWRHHEQIWKFSSAKVKGINVNGSSGYPKFFSLNELEHSSATSIQYLVEDRLFFRVSLNNDKPWLTCTL